MSARLAVASVRHRRASFAGTFLTAALAVALLAAGGLLLWSVLTAGPGADRFARADATVAGARDVAVTTTKDKGDKVKTKTKTERLTGAEPLPDTVVRAVAGVPGVESVVEDHAFPVALAAEGAPVAAPGAATVAHGWSSAALTPYRLVDGTAPGRGEVVLQRDLGVRPGTVVRLTSRTGTQELRVVGVVDGDVPGQAGVFVPDSQVPALSGLTGPTALAIRAEPAAVDAVAEAVDGAATVHTGADKVAADLPGAVPDYVGAVSVLGFTLGITGFAAIFVLTGTVSLSVRQRLRELALLRTIGATPRQLHRILRAEAAVVALLAAVPGLPAGVALAHVLAARFRALGAVPAQLTVDVNVPVLVAAVAAGVLVTTSATWVAARRAARIPPTLALQESAVAGRAGTAPRVVVAAVLVAGAVAVLTLVPLGGPFGMGMSFVASALLLCATVAVGPLLVGALTAAASRAVAVTGPLGLLAGSLARAGNQRVVGVVVPLTLMFALNATMLLSGDVQAQVTADQQVARSALSDVRVAATDGPGVPLDRAQDLARDPRVSGAAATIGTRVVVTRDGKPEDYPSEGLWATGEDALDLGVVHGDLGDLGSRTVAVSVPLARANGWAVGDRPTLWLADGTPVRPTIVATYTRWRGFGDLVLPAGLAAAHDPRGLVGSLYLRGDDVAAVVADVPGLAATAAADPRAGAADLRNQQAAWELMVVISLGFTAIAVVNTFAVSTAARRRELGDLRLSGATGRQVHGLLDREAVVAVAIALVLGCAVAGAVVGTFSIAQDGRWRLFADPLRYLGMVGAVGLLGIVAGAVPARIVVGRRSLPLIAG
ncbi:FtsX-like permease family protein [Isoptericola sp. NPDC057559]|uniref:ABC transporter permease n=1 Tax=Isoptericola sp. NPDC057559 TaxID=3346168 RepID=UPI0036BDF599